MSKFYGAIGYAIPTDHGNGVHTEEIVTRNSYGDIYRNSRRIQSSGNLNDDITISNEISIIADPFSYQNFHWMKYAEYMGAKWKITNVEVQRPRLILTLGGVYNG